MKKASKYNTDGTRKLNIAVPHHRTIIPDHVALEHFSHVPVSAKTEANMKFERFHFTDENEAARFAKALSSKGAYGQVVEQSVRVCRYWHDTVVGMLSQFETGPVIPAKCDVLYADHAAHTEIKHQPEFHGSGIDVPAEVSAPPTRLIPAIEISFAECFGDETKTQDTIELMRTSDVIMGNDPTTNNVFLAYGGRWLQQVASGDVVVPTVMMNVRLRQSSNELEYFLAAVQVAKGCHEYNVSTKATPKYDVTKNREENADLRQRDIAELEAMFRLNPDDGIKADGDRIVEGSRNREIY